MPQITKGGKFIFGRSLIREDLSLQLPPQAVEEYGLAEEAAVYLFTGSQITGGFCITRKGLLLPSRLGHILADTPSLKSYSAAPGTWIRYKGRSYCWTAISPGGRLQLSAEATEFLHLRAGMALLSIRSSDIAFTMGAKGPLLERAAQYDGEIPSY